MFDRPDLKSNSLPYFISSNPSSSKHVLGIRREDQSPWERRAPLAPEHVRTLVKNHNIKVLIQPSNRRAFPISSYVDAGAIVQEDLNEASAIIGVKQVSVDSLLPNKIYAMFSHTHKAQIDNMPLLDACLEKNITLIDYEKFVDEKYVRLVAFGKYAGIVGMINILHGLGLRFLALGHHTPFMQIALAHNYRNSEHARMAIRDAGQEIARGLMPKSIGPIIIVFTGAGNVSQGAQEVFRELPIEYVDVKALPEVVQHGAANKVYGCVILREDHLINKETGKYDEEEYLKHPERYTSTFSTKIAPYATCIINGIYWEPSHPKLLHVADANQLVTPPPEWTQNNPKFGCPSLPHRLLAICDITADKGGSIEIVQDTTSIDHPFLLYNPKTDTSVESFLGPGILICSIDNMPTQLPLEATSFFGSKLLPLIPQMLQLDVEKDFQTQTSVPRVVRDAVITANGQLTPKYAYISKLREQQRLKEMKASIGKRILVLGAGFVSGPVVEYLTRNEQVHVTVVNLIQQEMDRLVSTNSRITPILLDVTCHKSELDKLIEDHDCVVSLLPSKLHPDIASLCIKHRRHMVTASCVSPEMQALHDEALTADVTLINEVGLDPGIDHMLAMELFDMIRDNGGRIDSYVSYCGGLPAPEHSDNPLRFKFCWSPRSVLTDLLNPAKYLMKNKTIHEELATALGSKAPSYPTVAEWAKRFREGREGVNDDPRSGRPVSELTDENIELVREVINNDPHSTYDDIIAETFLSHGTIERIIHDCLKMKKLHHPVVKEIWKQRKSADTKGIKFLQDNARPHIHSDVINYLTEEGIIIMLHPPYSPDLAPCDYWLNNYIKRNLTDQPDEKLLARAVSKVMKKIPKEEFKKTFDKLLERMKLCINNHGDYFEHLIK
ncbi:unnamed protein product [Rotaria sp. Silwood2]|nr:unnamed protein product [Rotaria sp. Silwood2]